MWYSLEQLQEDIAVLRGDNGNEKIVERVKLPGDSKTGDVFRVENGEYNRDSQETDHRRKRIRQLQSLLRQKKK